MYTRGEGIGVRREKFEHNFLEEIRCGTHRVSKSNAREDSVTDILLAVARKILRPRLAHFMYSQNGAAPFESCAREELSAYSRSTGFPFFQMSTSSKIWENLFESSHASAFSARFAHKIYKKQLQYEAAFCIFCAREKTRTSMPLRALPPQGSASTNFATRALGPILLKFEIISTFCFSDTII